MNNIIESMKGWSANQVKVAWSELILMEGVPARALHSFGDSTLRRTTYHEALSASSHSVVTIEELRTESFIRESFLLSARSWMFGLGAYFLIVALSPVGSLGWGVFAAALSVTGLFLNTYVKDWDDVLITNYGNRFATIATLRTLAAASDEPQHARIRAWVPGGGDPRFEQ